MYLIKGKYIDFVLGEEWAFDINCQEYEQRGKEGALGNLRSWLEKLDPNPNM